MCPHSKSDESLSYLELRKMITYSDTLEASSHILDKAGFLECVYTPGEIYGEIRIMKILSQMHGGVE